MSQHVRVLLVMRRERRQPMLEKLDACPVEVEPACDWEEARHVLAKSSVDVVLTEPEGEWNAELESFGRKVRVVVCTRRGGQRRCAELFKKGAYDVLAEPYSGEELLKVLESAAAATYMHSLPTVALRAAG